MAKHIVLVGGGHSHVEVLRQFAAKPLAGVKLTLICQNTQTPYSGMLPGYVAGHYPYEAVHIDLRRLAKAAGAVFYNTAATGIHRSDQTVICQDATRLHYDQLSINIGSTPDLTDAPGASEHAIAVKPIRDFNARWLALLQRAEANPVPLSVAVVGGGAGGIELLLAMQYRLPALHWTLYTRGPHILPTHNTAVQNTFLRVLKARGVAVHCNAAVRAVNKTGLITEDGRHHPADEVIWVTRAGGAAWLKETGLALDSQGFVKALDTLQTETDPRIFVAGDIASMVNYRLEKSGVVAVRQAPVLAHNLRQAVQGRPLKPYRPQRRWLALISTGDPYAVASRGALHARGRWLWRYKDWIDRRFMQRYNGYLPRHQPQDR